MKLLTTLSLLFLFAFPQTDMHQFFKHFGDETNMKGIEEILGPEYTTSNGGLQLSNADGIIVRLDEYQYKQSPKRITIEQLNFGSPYMNTKAYKENPFLGLNPKMTKETCESHLRTLPNIKNLESKADMNGDYIKFWYTGNRSAESSKGIKVYIRFVQGKKGKYYPSYFTLSAH